jgi:hypothetical protein
MSVPVLVTTLTHIETIFTALVAIVSWEMVKLIWCCDFVFWRIAPCSPHVCLAFCCMLLLVRLTFNHEVGGDAFLRNVGSHTDYTVL